MVEEEEVSARGQNLKGAPGRKRNPCRGWEPRKTHPRDSHFPSACGYVPDRTVRVDDDLRRSIRRRLLAGVPSKGYHLLAPGEDDRVYDAHHGLGLYVPMVEHGFQLPTTPFRKEFLAYLRISPGQLHSNAWWVITTIEA
jgi:hypothetical protein